MKNGIDLVSIRLVPDRKLYSQKPIDSPESAVEVLRNEIKQYDREVLAVVNLQTDGKPININIVSIGTLNSSLASPSEIFKSAILANASSIIMLHNHPSGDCTPSRQDILITKRIRECGELLGIKLSDHIIIGQKENYSFVENNLMGSYVQLNQQMNENNYQIEDDETEMEISP